LFSTPEMTMPGRWRTFSGPLASAPGGRHMAWACLCKWSILQKHCVISKPV